MSLPITPVRRWLMTLTIKELRQLIEDNASEGMLPYSNEYSREKMIDILEEFVIGPMD